MSQASLPTSFWGFALETATFLLNRTPTKAVEKTPYEMWTGRKPNMSFLRIWGYESHVKRLTSDNVSVSPSPNTLYPDFIFDIYNMRHCFIIHYSSACMI